MDTKIFYINRRHLFKGAAAIFGTFPPFGSYGNGHSSTAKNRFAGWD